MPDAPAYRVLIDAISHLARVQREVGTGLARDLDCSRTSLALLWMLNRHGDLGIGELAQRLHVDISVASRQATALVESGYAERRIPVGSGVDRRVRLIGLTDAGRAFTARARHELDERAGRLFDDWTAEELRSAAAALDRIAETIAHRTGDLAELRASVTRAGEQAAEQAIARTAAPAPDPISPGVLAGAPT
ncbi:MAG TPA: MarR family transcriptional regulator [Cellulomonas sp.]